MDVEQVFPPFVGSHFGMSGEQAFQLCIVCGIWTCPCLADALLEVFAEDVQPVPLKEK
jgi:hypothetical protein